MKACTFCAIAAGDVEGSQIAETELCPAFLTIDPCHPGHALVIPKRRALQEAGTPAQLGQRVAQAL
ncbi:HIT family protein [Deinococcus hopiensis]|uniref:Diadenosine tetraphosphate (Ap4A) hydrolase and other HIT family hydrolases n=1 Tax=Deinococcus hopiensis KR-140 TaxID=695939 RepID=A0A1W1VRT8_9DEIO|nr:HIT family protein [Deinococcus hopiensis]SMB95973.1 Diadenosine tetraphosphate (Ap4A) hydrolase and other HIT family hydrolases [Deinococcus hopiensis KR-140]